jgi:hypothetical protein
MGKSHGPMFRAICISQGPGGAKLRSRRPAYAAGVSTPLDGSGAQMSHSKAQIMNIQAFNVYITLLVRFCRAMDIAD